MEASIALSGRERKRLMDVYRSGHDPAQRLRAHILLLLAGGQSWLTISLVLFCSTATIARWKRRYERRGVEAVLGPKEHAGRPPALWRGWAAVVARWAKGMSPLDFGYVRSRWCCATLALVLSEVHQVAVCPETVRVWLHRQQMVWRRPRPTLDRTDPNRARVLRGIRRLLGRLADDEAAVFSDEVDVSTNPRIGSMWMARGQQAAVPTPGDSAKRHVAGSMDWRSGQMTTTVGARRDAGLFLAHLDELRRRYGGYRKVHVICDNASFHRPDRCKQVAAYLEKWGERIELHFLPKYAPETNPVERVWWHLHEEVTRNHRCHDIDRLVGLVMRWLEERGAFRIEGHVYDTVRKAAA